MRSTDVSLLSGSRRGATANEASRTWATKGPRAISARRPASSGRARCQPHARCITQLLRDLAAPYYYPGAQQSWGRKQSRADRGADTSGAGPGLIAAPVTGADSIQTRHLPREIIFNRRPETRGRARRCLFPGELFPRKTAGAAAGVGSRAGEEKKTGGTPGLRCRPVEKAGWANSHRSELFLGGGVARGCAGPGKVEVRWQI